MYMTDCILINIIHVLYTWAHISYNEGHKIQSKSMLLKWNVGHLIKHYKYYIVAPFAWFQYEKKHLLFHKSLLWLLV